MSLRAARARLAERRTVRIARRRLDAELAAFASAPDRAEIEALIEAHSCEDSVEVRALLRRQDARRLHVRG